MINLGITLFVIAACFYVGILYENVKILLCGTALAILLVLSVAEVLYRLFTLKCQLEIPISMTEKNHPVNIGIRVVNSGEIVSGKIRLCMSIHNAMRKKGKKTWFSIGNIYTGDFRYDFPILISESGCQEIELFKVRIYAYSGLVYFTKKCRQSGSIIVMPQIHSVGVRISEPVRNFMGDADIYDDIRPGHDPSEMFEIREYREKDKLQSIHWKLSAKMDDLMVREKSLPVACAIVVFLDPQKNTDKKKQEMTDGFLEAAASISFALIDKKCAHFVAWYSRQKGEIIRTRVDDEESFYIFLSYYLMDGMFTEQTDIRASYKERFRGEYYLYDILINSNLEIYKNGEMVKKIDTENISDECEKLEILL